MPKTLNGKPQALGTTFWTKDEQGIEKRKYCTGYCNFCHRKQGLTRAELEEFSRNMPGLIENFIIKLFHIRILIPQ